MKSAVFGHSKVVRQRPMKSLSFICPSVYPSLSLKIGSLFSSDIVHDVSWPWYLLTDGARFLKTKNLGQMDQNRAWN